MKGRIAWLLHDLDWLCVLNALLYLDLARNWEIFGGTVLGRLIDQLLKWSQFQRFGHQDEEAGGDWA